MALPYEDVTDLYKMGARYARDRDVSALEEAVSYWVIATSHERPSVRMNFLEGARNYAVNMSHFLAIQEFFRKRCLFVDADQTGFANAHYSKEDL